MQIEWSETVIEKFAGVVKAGAEGAGGRVKRRVDA
jgi:hypothetical protein